jgi:lipopolysaccharide export system permease protein
MPLIIYRYLILEILPPFWVSLLAFTSIVFLGRLMKITQMIVVKGVGLWEVLQTCLFLLPYLLVFTLPMAATVGILLSLTRLTVDHEVTALKTAGLASPSCCRRSWVSPWLPPCSPYFSRSSAVPGARLPPESC